jgi:hypothetical protein
LWIEQASKRIEKETGRVFIADTDASSRFFDLERRDIDTLGRYSGTPRDVFIDDATEIGRVVSAGEDVGSTDMVFYPANETPKMRIHMRDTVSASFDPGEQMIEVVAKWGYSEEVPQDIEFAATVMAAQIFQYGRRNQGQQQSKTMGRYSVTFNTQQKLISDLEQVQNILDSYKKLL